MSAQIPSLLPSISAILLLDSSDGSRIASKYYGDFMLSKKGTISKETEDMRDKFEKTLHKKTRTISAKSDVEVTLVSSMTSCFKSGNGLKIYLISEPSESELVVSHVLEGFYDALKGILGGSIEKAVILDNLELLMLLIDEFLDGGYILECDARRLMGRVLMRSPEELSGG
eukprot:CAMPEP_0118661310 /NCGR_PEP_ID=MMETSP0785-20121206/16206_1 /TAXON_ID=91992 /ORGANISM="Bolidomonas pacifica, Strain CCMP 1866" /LENGTH=170 /DNA_ID=CAMNT_0006554731 /DNA_START=75 /DNA_END=584 /DNA_ORIENTATION=+